MLKLVDRIEGKSYKGSKRAIKTLLYKLYKEYSYLEILKGTVFIKDTWYIG